MFLRYNNDDDNNNNNNNLVFLKIQILVAQENFVEMAGVCVCIYIFCTLSMAVRWNVVKLVREAQNKLSCLCYVYKTLHDTNILVMKFNKFNIFNSSDINKMKGFELI